MFFKVSPNKQYTLNNLKDNENFYDFWLKVFECENYVVGAESDWTKINIKNMSQYIFSKWCLENCKHKWATAKTIEGQYSLHFEAKHEAILFKLRVINNG